MLQQESTWQKRESKDKKAELQHTANVEKMKEKVVAVYHPRRNCKFMTMEDAWNPAFVEKVESSHEWNVRSVEEYGLGISGVMVTLDCIRCGTEKSILMIQQKGN